MFRRSPNLRTQQRLTRAVIESLETRQLLASIPATPDEFWATAINSSEIVCDWNDRSSDETGFKIERKQGDNGTWQQIAMVGADVETFLDSGLPAGTRFVYRARAYNDAGHSSYSNSDGSSTKTDSTPSPTPGTAPAAPDDFWATATSSSEILLEWDDNSGNETGFAIERKQGNSGTWEQIATVGADVETYLDSGLPSSTRFVYRVRAYNDAGHSGYSNSDGSSTKAGTSPTPTPTPTLPSAPDDFWATATSSSEIFLEWDDNSSNETGFKIERMQGDNGVWQQIATVGANVDTYLDSSLPANTRFVYRVRAYNDAGNSGYSNSDGSSTKGSSTTLPSTTISWSTKASSPIKRAEAIGGVVNGKLYVLGGLYLGTNGEILATTRCDVYDPATDKWTRLDDMPEKLTHAQAVIDGGNMYFIGGYVGDHPGAGTNHVWKYNTTTDTWSRLVNLPIFTGSGGAALLGRELHYFGGMNEARTEESPNHYALNLDDPNATWVRKADLLNPRNHTAGAVISGVLYCIGGQYNQEEFQIAQDDIEAYDPVNDQWVKVADLPTVRSHHQSSTFVYNNQLIIIGGETGSESNVRQVTAWNPVTNTFTELTRLPSARSTQVAGVLPDGRIIASTGNAPSPSDTTWIGTFV